MSKPSRDIQKGSSSRSIILVKLPLQPDIGAKHLANTKTRSRGTPYQLRAILMVTRINVIGFYAPILFRTIGFGESASLMSSVMIGVVGIVTTFITTIIVDKVGRRFLLIIGGIITLGSQIIVGVIVGVKLGDHSILSKGYADVVLVLIGIYVAGFGVSWGPLGWLIPSEIFPLEIRSAGQSINVAVNFLFTFLVGQTFLSMLCHFKYGLSFFFGGWVAVMTGFVYFLLLETKNVPIEQMEKIWKEHWF
ncbi:hypothetical protein CDL12_22903 [Handroanthus impetiginosus]|uniref:Major facilitator superfamily (MFS) profile domain-containing protein n=1 Tax=Handroanthus impetiginosus TaxID=429701 RepID=A0A2G9GH02_9LAMI|nr:hypothetical protein CDL12_22903 [Handroanthus impetiginosus]